ncbi:MAG TPA: TIR domain-containing protein [Archangium sp.]|nr:TIR domain-containing protein [Archangium sp.]
MTARHKVFASYHHANDQNYKNIFDQRFSGTYDILVRGSVQLGDIDPNIHTETVRRTIRDEHLADSSVTVVLVGTQTWQRKHVDWEIYASLRDTPNSPRSGLVGILLPSYWQLYGAVNQYTLPPRLWDNVQCGFAKLYRWTEEPAQMQHIIHEAYLNKSKVQPNNARLMFANNRTGDRWHP